jgi:hypothetical protein
MFPAIIGQPCIGEYGDVWMGPFLFAVVGIPATLISIIIIIWAVVGKIIRRAPRNGSAQ